MYGAVKFWFELYYLLFVFAAPEVFVKTLGDSIQAAFQLEPPAFDGKSRQMLH